MLFFCYNINNFLVGIGQAQGLQGTWSSVDFNQWDAILKLENNSSIILVL
jgi:hypothetical protein